MAPLAANLLLALVMLPGGIWEKSPKSDTPRFRFTLCFQQGSGYIDRSGRIAIPAQFDEFDAGDADFYNGIAMVQSRDGTWYIDRAGRRLFRTANHLAQPFSEGLAVFSRQELYGYLDRTGHTVIAPVFNRAGSFSEGLAAALSEAHYGYIDKTGAWAIPPRYAQAEPFRNGAARVVEDGICSSPTGGGLREPIGLPPCRYHFIDRRGRRLFETAYENARDFSANRAPVADRSYHWGYVDRSGTVRIALQFDDAASFREGLARVRVNGKWGYVDRSGSFVIQPAYSDARDFSEGLAAVEKAPHCWLYINRAGHRVIGGNFRQAGSFVQGRANVCTAGDCAWINRAGRRVFTYRYSSNPAPPDAASSLRTHHPPRFTRSRSAAVPR
jgi:hypothetical protein